MKPRVLLLAVCTFSISFCTGFSCKGNPNAYFVMETFDKLTDKPGGAGALIERPYQIVGGDFQSATQFTQGSGTKTVFNGYTDDDGNYPVTNAMFGVWLLTTGYSENCGPNNYIGTEFIGTGLYYLYSTSPNNPALAQGDSFPWVCEHYTVGDLPDASTRFVDLSDPPESLSFSSTGPLLSTSYGMPQLYVYGETTTASGLLQTLTATSVSADQTTATFPVPQGLPGGVYGVSLINQGASGPSYADWNFLSLGARQTFASPFGVAAQVGTVTASGHSQPPGTGHERCSGSITTWNTTTPLEYPIVSEASNGVLNVNGSLVPVGSNPGPVIAYDSGPVTTTTMTDNDCTVSTTTTTAFQRAIVANTGSNTLSVVNLTNAAAIGTITVGTNPVAIVMSADQSTVYSANSGSGTISQVNLSTNAVTGTATIGAPLTALDFAADGSIWAGGPNGLYHVNVSTMQVSGSYAMNGQQIIGLKYSLSGSELVLTTVSSGGSVSIVEVNPATTVSSQQLAVTASRAVADSSSSTNPQAYAHTQVAHSLGLPEEFAGSTMTGVSANDGWLTVSGVPGGFVVTDTTNHIQLMQGSTPGDVTAIAIDPTEQVAYLAVPDAGIVMTINLFN